MNAEQLNNYEPFLQEIFGNYTGPYVVEVTGEDSLKILLPNTPHASLVAKDCIVFATNPKVFIEYDRTWIPDEATVLLFDRKNKLKGLQDQYRQQKIQLEEIKKQIEELSPSLGLWLVSNELMFSSHDDAIAIFSTKEKAEAYTNKRNGENKGNELCKCNQCKNSFFYRKIITSRFADEEDLSPGAKWLILNNVPSVGEFSLFPESSTEVQTFVIDKENND